MGDPNERRTYGVKLVRGPFVRPPRHPEPIADDLEQLIENRASVTGPTCVDLFSGCGGLSLGLEQAGFTSLLALDTDAVALETWSSWFPGVAVNADLGVPEVVEGITKVISDLEVDLIAGGPPCQPFSRAGRSKLRHLVAEGRREQHDRRRELWRSFIEIVRGVHPPAVLIENVPDLALGDEMTIFRTIVDELEDDGYVVSTRLVDAPDFGVPQMRQRLLVIATLGGGFTWPIPTRPVTLAEAIADLPAVEGGWRPEGGADGWAEYREPSASNSFVKRMRADVAASDLERVYDHITRPVRDDDRVIFEGMTSSSKYTDVDKSLRRYRDDIFDDKYKRLDYDKPSRAITAHIAKDGYWYIHPDQHRTLTVREAARIQTFPDHLRWAGPPSAAFRQIGNAVPPLLAEHIGRALLEPRDESTLPTSTKSIAGRLATWFIERDEFALPWLLADSPWKVISAEILLHRAARSAIRLGWGVLSTYESPGRTVDCASQLNEVGRRVRRDRRTSQVLAAASWFLEHGSDFSSAAAMAANPHVPVRVARLAELVAVVDSDIPVIASAGVLRVAARFNGSAADKTNRMSAGRMEIARLVGGSLLVADNIEARMAHAALVEIANAVCTTANPLCVECPLIGECVHAGSTGIPAG